MFDSRNTWNVNCNAQSITKFCACRKKWQSKIWEKPAQTSCAVRVWSEHDPTMAPRMNGSVRSPTTEVILRAEQAHFLENYNISRSGYHSKFHNSSAPAMKSECATWMQLYQILRLARKPAVVLLLYYFLTLLFFDPTSLLLYYSFFCFALQFFWLQSLYFLLRDIVHMSEIFQLNFLW